MDALRSKSGVMDYTIPSVFRRKSSEQVKEIDILNDKKRKNETAINRLHSLYLYDSEGIPEKDYLIERRKLEGELDEINSRIAEICNAEGEQSELDNDEFVAKGSYFLMVEQIMGKNQFNYEKYVRNADPEIPKNFIRSIIDHIDVRDSKVMNIVFSNGIECHFIYGKENDL
jgi:hypothetical protein